MSCKHIDQFYDNEMGRYICSKCFVIVGIKLVDDTPYSQDGTFETKEKLYTQYNNKKQFINVLIRLQAKEYFNLTPLEKQTILNNISYTDMCNLNIIQIKHRLNNIKLKKCYNHIQYIKFHLYNIPPLVLKLSEIELLTHLYNICYNSFKTLYFERHNFLNTNYLLTKFAKLHNLHHLIPYLQPMRSKKYNEHEEIFTFITNNIGW